MAHYGDPEAHRCILEEISAIPVVPRLMPYLKAAVMGSQGSDVGLQLLRRFPSDYKQSYPHLEVMLALLSLTVYASKAHPGFRAEQKRVQELMGQKREGLKQQAERTEGLRSCSDGGSGRSGSGLSTFLPSSGMASFPTPFSSIDTNSASPGAGLSAAVESKEEKLNPVQQWEQSMDILNYCEAYVNYLHGFTELWCELFGPNYYYYDDAANGILDGDDDGDGEETWARPQEAGKWASLGSPVSHLQSSPQQSRQHQQHAQRCRRPPRVPQAPPHLYAVCWSDILTPQRRAWFHGLHNVVKELLVRILHRELPLELYVLFIQYASLSLRMYLLQAVAEVFEWTSHFIDVIYYVHVMRQSYGIQCEMSQLQRVWSSFGLYDARFLVDCHEFNKMYTELQGAFSEQQEVALNRPTTAPSSLSAQTGAAATVAVLLTALGDGDLAHQSSSGTGDITARASSCTLAVSAASATTLSSDFAAVASARVHQIFPSRDAAGNTLFDAADSGHSTGPRTPDERVLSSASDCEATAAVAGEAKRAVYLPLFCTCCCFTWILQRTFWSMYGRCSLLFESCLGIGVAPQVSSLDGCSEFNRDDTPVFFTNTQLGTRRHVGVASSSGVPSLPLSPASFISHMDSGAAARTHSASTSAISITTTRCNVTSHPSALETPAREDGAAGKGEAVAAAGRPPQAAQMPSHCTPSPTSSQQQLRFSVAAANTHLPPHAVADGAQANAAVVSLARNAAGSEQISERRRKDGIAFSLGSVFNRFVQRRQRRHGCGAVAEGGSESAGDMSTMAKRAQRDAFPSLSISAGTPPPTPAGGNGARGERISSLFLANSGAPFYLQYTHRAGEIQLYDNPSLTFTNGGVDNKGENTFFFEEFYFLRETGCYGLSHAVRSLTCYPHYPATLLILTDNTTRPGWVSWCDHKFSVLSSSTGDEDGRRGLRPWVLSAVIPNTRLSSIHSVRMKQEEALLKHIVFQVAGAQSERICFCTSNSIFFVLNSGSEMDGGRLYFVLHLHVDLSTQRQFDSSIDTVMKAESQWAFLALGELHVSWAMSCTCNEALRVAFQIGSGEEKL
ncbi:hypothetical protein, conserved [Leishmania lindenbergi]|uniref:Uncharacterized protein n=1 Tax=Leishmania lindenbergi TaxID=651832 RepID=A0AAW2ZZN7_9TRYP